jgi:glycosyltransferase involved in cell wall biosynthesis
MRICFVCKYPPIQGGVSAQTYWIARGLARRGHEIFVVTNADEVEPLYKIELTDEDAVWYRGDFPESGGRVEVFNAQSFHASSMGHIPRSNPFVSKLAGLAAQVTRVHECELIFSYYYEPYGVAGWLAAQWTGVPFIIKHAGSDLDRIMGVPDLATTYREILSSADAVVTQPRFITRFLGLGVHPKRLLRDVAFGIQREVFTPQTEPMVLSGIDKDIPTIGMYGKIGQTKGTFDLIKALGQVRVGGSSFRLLFMIGEAQGKLLADHLAEAGIADWTRILPLLPNWRVPEFIRSCTAVCFLERDFPVVIHGPIVPREILACGTALILSGEIAAKQHYQAKLINNRNVIIVEDPKQTDDLSAAIDTILKDPHLAHQIGIDGHALSCEIEGAAQTTEQWESLFRAVRDRAVTGQELRLVEDREVSTSGALDLLLPGITPYLNKCFPDHVKSFLLKAAPTNVFKTGISFTTFAEEKIACDMPPARAAQFVDTMRYLRARLRILLSSQDMVPFAATDRVSDREFSLEKLGYLHPIHSGLSIIECFNHDPTNIVNLDCSQDLDPAQAFQDALDAIPTVITHVLFQQTVNLISHEMRVDPSAQTLLALCDGQRTLEELNALYTRDLSKRDADLISLRMLEALQHFHRNKVIVFADYRDGWGWLGGSRGKAGPSSIVR